MFVSQFVNDKDKTKKILKLLEPYDKLQWDKNTLIPRDIKNFTALFLNPYWPDYKSVNEYENNASFILAFIADLWQYKSSLSFLSFSYIIIRDACEKLNIRPNTFPLRLHLNTLYSTVSNHKYIEKDDLIWLNSECGKYHCLYIKALGIKAQSLSGHERALFLLRNIPIPLSEDIYILLIKIYGTTLGFNILIEHIRLLQSIEMIPETKTFILPDDIIHNNRIPDRLLYLMYQKTVTYSSPMFIPLHKYSCDTLYPLFNASDNQYYKYWSTLAVFTFFFKHTRNFISHSSNKHYIRFKLICTESHFVKYYNLEYLLVPWFIISLGMSITPNDSIELYYESRDKLFYIFEAFLNANINQLMMKTIINICWQLTITLEDFILVEEIMELLYKAFVNHDLFISHNGDLIFNGDRMNGKFINKTQKYIFMQRYLKHPLYAILSLKIHHIMLNDCVLISYAKIINGCPVVELHKHLNYVNMFGSNGTVTQRLAQYVIFSKHTVKHNYILNKIQNLKPQSILDPLFSYNTKIHIFNYKHCPDIPAYFPGYNFLQPSSMFITWHGIHTIEDNINTFSNSLIQFHYSLYADTDIKYTFCNDKMKHLSKTENVLFDSNIDGSETYPWKHRFMSRTILDINDTIQDENILTDIMYNDDIHGIQLLNQLLQTFNQNSNIDVTFKQFINILSSKTIIGLWLLEAIQAFN